MLESTARTKERVASTELVIRPQSPREEYDYLWFVLRQVPFYRQNGYTFEVPEHPIFSGLAQSSPDLGDVKPEALYDTFVSEVYQSDFFKPGLEALEGQRENIVQAFPRFAELNAL